MARSMSGLAVVFLVLALIAAVLGFGIISEEPWVAAKMFFLVFCALAVLSFMWAWMSRSGIPARY
jgi:uncharacterized membrane protein YtjA (UPF0391 family)